MHAKISKRWLHPRYELYHASMVRWGINKLDDVRHSLPSAGGLVITPTIAMAEYFCDIIQQLDGERPSLVHSQLPNADQKIAAFRRSTKKWIVSVAMISEGVDIRRLRVLIYLHHSQTELSFRQAVGRVVRNNSKNDMSRAYVIMPTHKIFEVFARRVEDEMSPAAKKDSVQHQKFALSAKQKIRYLQKSAVNATMNFQDQKLNFLHVMIAAI